MIHRRRSVSVFPFRSTALFNNSCLLLPLQRLHNKRAQTKKNQRSNSSSNTYPRLAPVDRPFFSEFWFVFPFPLVVDSAGDDGVGELVGGNAEFVAKGCPKIADRLTTLVSSSQEQLVPQHHLVELAVPSQGTRGTFLTALPPSFYYISILSHLKCRKAQRTFSAHTFKHLPEDQSFSVQ